VIGDPDAPDVFWALRIANGSQYHLREAEGYRVRDLLSVAGPCGFLEAVDFAGSPLLLNTALIESMFLSTPATRAYDKPWAEARTRWEKEATPESEKPWEAE
jgi:hypothetical protein